MSVSVIKRGCLVICIHFSVSSVNKNKLCSDRTRRVGVFAPMPGTSSQICCRTQDGLSRGAINRLPTIAAMSVQDKMVKVWDIRNYKCLQTITDKTAYHPEDALAAVLFDGRHSRLVTANLALAQWPLCELEGSGARGHCAAVTAVLYNRVFSDAVSGDRAGTVCAWNTRTGHLRFRCCFPP